MWINLRVYKMRLTDMRMTIYLLSFVSCLNVLIHYGLQNTHDRGSTFFVIEMLRFTIFFSITYYYCDRASGLLPNKKFIKMILKVLFAMCMVFIIAIGVFLIVD